MSDLLHTHLTQELVPGCPGCEQLTQDFSRIRTYVESLTEDYLIRS